MTRLVVVGFAILLNVGILVGGIIWAKQQMKRVVAERAAADERRGPVERADAPQAPVSPSAGTR